MACPNLIARYQYNRARCVGEENKEGLRGMTNVPGTTENLWISLDLTLRAATGRTCDESQIVRNIRMIGSAESHLRTK